MDNKKLAKTLPEDFVAEEKWDAALANSDDKLAALADEALIEFEQGETRPLEESLCAAAQTIMLLETIPGPVQAALLALAIRRKFMR